MFDTQYSPHIRVSANPGSPVKVLYSGKYDANGRVVLEKKGEENLYDYIQSFRDSVDLNVILMVTLKPLIRLRAFMQM